MQPVPDIRVFAAHPVQIRSGALGTPEEWAIVDRLTGTGVGTVALDLGQQWPNLLRMTDAAAFPDINISAGQLEGAIGPGRLGWGFYRLLKN